MIYYIISVIINYILTFFIVKGERDRGLDITLDDLIWASLFGLVPLFTVITYMLFCSGNIVILKGRKK